MAGELELNDVAVASAVDECQGVVVQYATT